MKNNTETKPSDTEKQETGGGWMRRLVRRLLRVWNSPYVSEWMPITTAPTNGEQRIIIAEIRNGELIAIDFDAVLEQEQESWELPQTYWVWKSACGNVEDPTHWMPLPSLMNA